MQPDRDGHASIGYPDFLLIDRVLDDGNLKFAEAFLNYKTNLGKREADQRQEKMQKLDAENAENLARVKGEEERAAAEHENELAKDLESHKEEEKRQTEREKHDMEMERIRLEKSLEPSADGAGTNQ